MFEDSEDVIGCHFGALFDVDVLNSSCGAGADTGLLTRFNVAGGDDGRVSRKTRFDADDGNSDFRFGAHGLHELCGIWEDTAGEGEEPNATGDAGEYACEEQESQQAAKEGGSARRLVAANSQL